jgi:flagellin FlaB
MRRLVRRLFGNQQGITGIETAIILIAFVIVASVFAYVVLSAGLFSTQKAKEAITAGLNEARSTIAAC